MASWLVLDWDQDQFHILCAQSSRRGVQVSRAVTWAHPEPLTPSTAERVGKALREFLKVQKIAAAPVILGMGRDRIFLKELRIPPIAAHEEASLVRFQTGKEMAEGVDNYAIDYSYLTSGEGERHIMTVAARRDIIALGQAVCQAAGLRLHAITPKLFGIPLALVRAIQPDPSPLERNRLNVVLSVGQRWAELCFFRGDRLLQAQALANGPLLAGEVKRNLAVFQAQHAVDVNVEGPGSLYVFGDDPAALSSLQAGQSLPVVALDPLKPESALDVRNRAAFAGAVGLAALWSQSAGMPVNLASPKRAQAPTTVTQQRVLLYGAAAAVLALFLVVGMVWVLASKRAQVAQLTQHQNDQKDSLSAFAQERADLDAYKDWEQSSIPWLDEIYDLSARYPFEVGFRVNQLFATTTGAGGAKKNTKDPFVARMSLSGITPKEKDRFVYDLISSMARDPHVRPGIGPFKGNDYSMKIDVAKQDLKKYQTVLKVLARPNGDPLPPPEEPKVNGAEKNGNAPMPDMEKKLDKKDDDDDDDEKGDGK